MLSTEEQAAYDARVTKLDGQFVLVRNRFETLVPPGFPDSTLSYFELAKPGPSEAYHAGQWRFERSFFVWPWTARLAFCSWMLGWGFVEPGTETVKRAGVYRFLPQPFPAGRARLKVDKPGAVERTSTRPLAYASEVLSIEYADPSAYDTDAGFALADTVPQGLYLGAKIRVGYSSLPYSVVPDSEMPKMSQVTELRTDGRSPGDVTDERVLDHPDESSLLRFVSRSMRPAGKHLSFPNGQMVWKSDNAGTGQTIGKVFSYTDLDYTWHRVPLLPEAAHRGKTVGTVNQYTFDGCPPGTLLLLGVELESARQPNGWRGFDIRYRMRYFEPDPTNAAQTGHNWFPRMKEAKLIWDRPEFLTDGTSGERIPVFGSSDFDDLFRGPFVNTVGWSE